MEESQVLPDLPEPKIQTMFSGLTPLRFCSTGGRVDPPFPPTGCR
jgi:hypothetical protein